jgi:hypothetical protein
MKLNDNTTVAKTIKVGLWLALSAAISALIAYIASLDSDSLSWLIPAVNVVLVFLKNLADKNIANI